MIDINNYIVEKLKLNKDIKATSVKINHPKDGDYDYINKLDVNDIISSYYIAKDTKFATKAERLWIAIMLKTKSKPFIFKNTICSYPGNFGRDLLDKVIDSGFDLEDIYYQYDIQKEDEDENILNSLSKYYKQMIDAILVNMVDKNIKYIIKDIDESNYSNEAKALIRKRNGIIVLPIEVRLNNKKADIELGFVGSSYYHYWIDGKKYHISRDFANKLFEKLS